MRSKVQATVLLLFAFNAYAVDDKSVVVSGEDSEMLRAVKQTQEGLDGFLALYSKPPQGASRFKLKVKFVGAGITEHMWITPFKQTGTGFVGVLADEPDYIKTLKFGQRVAFQRSEITDWGYELNGKQKGSFTVCVLFKRMPVEEVKQYREQYGFEC